MASKKIGCVGHDCGKCLSPGEARKLRAENKRLRTALLPMTRGTYYINRTDVARAFKALGMQPNA